MKIPFRFLRAALRRLTRRPFPLHEIKPACPGDPLLVTVLPPEASIELLELLQLNTDAVSVPRAPADRKAACDLKVAESSFVFRHYTSRHVAAGRLCVPSFVETLLAYQSTFEGTLKAMTGRTLRRDVRRVANMAYTAELGDTENDLAFFYQELYLPMVRRRHGEKGHVVSWEAMRACRPRGCLVFLQQDGRRIAGNFLLTSRADPRRIRHQWMGIADDCLASARVLHNTTLALAYHVLKFHHERGYAASNLGLSRPLPTVGALPAKIQWGAEVILPADPLLFDMVFYSRAHLHRWLRRSPVIHLVGGAFYVSALWPQADGAMPEAIVMRIAASVFFKNLAGIFFHGASPDGHHPATLLVKGRTLRLLYC